MPKTPFAVIPAKAGDHFSSRIKCLFREKCESILVTCKCTLNEWGADSPGIKELSNA
ncbi:hypothetical protein MBAV_003485 [Candidatus Magnetobacterium bavaricum]|uniref:Uncharacterized protein n=1 Tax=Candidatus Magnetobacterium bavaricum TaxID=29290 RepID=A0A0F3GRD4_9BACT|nr:hypothetical protein MBAV_003485 [Candidatus Magnetobacterium bavaricum]